VKHENMWQHILVILLNSCIHQPMYGVQVSLLNEQRCGDIFVKHHFNYATARLMDAALCSVHAVRFLFFKETFKDE
jgi:hypothetical protein